MSAGWAAKSQRGTNLYWCCISTLPVFYLFYTFISLNIYNIPILYFSFTKVHYIYCSNICAPGTVPPRTQTFAQRFTNWENSLANNACRGWWILSFTAVLVKEKPGVRRTAMPTAQTGGAQGVKFLIKSELIVLSENYKALKLHCCCSNYKSCVLAWVPLIKWQSGSCHINLIVFLLFFFPPEVKVMKTR